MGPFGCEDADDVRSSDTRCQFELLVDQGWRQSTFAAFARGRPRERIGRRRRSVDMDVASGAQRRTPPPRGHKSAPPQMTVALDPLFQSALDALAFPGVLIGHRLISPGDEHALLPEEAPAFASSVVKVRRASGAARVAVRPLLARLGYPECPVPRAPSGAPVWPMGVVGSMAHDARVAVAAVGSSRGIC